MRRTSGLLFLPAFVAVCLLVLGRRSTWVGGWNSTLEIVLGTTVLLGPLVAAAGASITVGEARLSGLYEAMPRGWLVPLVAAGRAWLLATGVVTFALAGACLRTAAGPHGGPAAWWVLALAPLLLAACALVGAWAGHRFPALVTVVLVGPALFLLGALGPPEVAELLRNGPAVGSLAGLTYDPVVFVAKTLGLLGLSGTAALLLVPAPLRTATTRTTLAASIGLVVAGPCILANHGTERFTLSGEGPTDCRGSQPVVCLAPSDARQLEPLARRMEELGQVLRRHGLRVPDRYEDRLPGGDLRERSGLIVRVGGPWNAEERTWRDAARSMVRPRPCVAWHDPERPPPDSAYDAQALLGEWLLREAGQEPHPWNDATESWLATPVDEEQLAWVRGTWQAMLSCDVGALALPG